MSLKETTILDETVNRLSQKAFEFFEEAAKITIKLVIRGRQPSKRQFTKIKQLAKEISEICEELP